MHREVRIAVFIHAFDRFDREGYVLNALIENWRSAGIRTEVVQGVVDSPPAADLAFSHIDMTATPDEYLRMFSAYPMTINGQVRDISKTTFSELIIGRDDPWQGPVLIKTNRNFGGMREYRQRMLSGDPTASLDVQRPWRKMEVLPAYPVFETKNQVPPGAWRNPNLVVEKFRPERHPSGEYALRQWVFLGDRGVCYQSFAREAIVKGKNTIRRVVLDPAEVPEPIKAVRRRLGFDYGKFDFGIVDGEPLLYDVNRTPGLPRSGTEADKVTRHYPELALGLDELLKKLAD